MVISQSADTLKADDDDDDGWSDEPKPARPPSTAVSSSQAVVDKAAETSAKMGAPSLFPSAEAATPAPAPAPAPAPKAPANEVRKRTRSEAGVAFSSSSTRSFVQEGSSKSRVAALGAAVAFDPSKLLPGARPPSKMEPSGTTEPHFLP